MVKYPSEPLSGFTAADLGWLSGNWRGQLADNIIEEVWSGPAAGTLMGQEATFLRRGGEEPLWMVYRREGRASLIAYFAKEGQEFDPADAFRYELAL